MKRLLLLVIFATFVVCANGQDAIHVVRSGETEQSIAKLYGITISKLKELNPYLEFYPLKVNSKIRIPQEAAKVVANKSNVLQTQKTATKPEQATTSTKKPQPITQAKQKQDDILPSVKYIEQREKEKTPEAKAMPATKNKTVVQNRTTEEKEQKGVVTVGVAKASRTNTTAEQVRPTKQVPWVMSSLDFSYKPTSIKWSDNQEYYENGYPAKHSLALGYALHNFSYAVSFRMFFEGQYTFGNYETSYAKNTLSIFSLNLGCGLGYGFELDSQQKYVIAPYVGLNARFNCYGRAKVNYESNEFKDLEYKLFDSTELSKIDYDEPIPLGTQAWKFFQVGLDVGIDIKLGSLLLGVSYVVDFNKMIKVKTDDFKYTGNFRPVSIKLGVAF